MKVNIEMELKDGYDEEKLKRIVHSDDAFSLIWDIDSKIRNHLKYGSEENDVETLEGIREMICESKLMEYWS
jgi:hypothetical protein